jgi:hypothetical protein
MKTHRSALLVLIALLTLAAGTSRAEFVQVMNIRVTASMQMSTTNRGSLTIDKTRQVRLTTKDLLQMMGAATTNDFAGATLVTVDYGTAFQVRRATNIVADVSDFFGQTPSDVVFDAVYDNDTGKDSYRGQWVRTFIFDDGVGNHIELTGLVQERYSASAADVHGTQRLSDTATFNGSGAGTLNNTFAIFNGGIVASGVGTRSP